MTGPTRVLIYGSCVARDSLAHAGPERLALVRYIARQSLISAYSPAAVVPDGDLHTSSAFQRRMIDDDVRGSLPAALVDDADRTDLVLWDLTDERMGVLVSPEGHVITRSVDSVSSGLVDRLRGWRLVAFGSDEHFAAWRTALGRLTRQLAAIGLADRVLLLAVPWATIAEDAGTVPRSAGLTSHEANAMFARYYDAAAEAGLRVAAVEPDRAVAGASHRWGRAPFHYATSTYDDVVLRIEREVAVTAGGRPE
ncbi:DUF6270 domain-containing protein [Cellulomonas fimi]|uniref:DUF6270 domain-containing protein n=1 Tax=Cellulomonas sp. RIT-PI-Y TaxID=3035297 RepID=UPI0021D82705